MTSTAPPTRYEALHGPAHREARAFWMGAMVGPDDALRWAESFVFETPAPPGTRHSIVLDAESRRLVSSVAGGNPLAEFVVVLGGLVVLLHRTTGRDVIWLESPLLRDVVASYDLAPVVPLVFRVDPVAPYRELLDGVRRTVSASYSAQGYPVRELWSQGGVDGDARVVVTEVGLHEPVTADQDPDVVVRIDLTAGVLDLEDRRGAFPAEFLQRTAGHLNRVLHHIARPDTAVADLELLGDDERDEQLVVFTDTAVPELATDDSLVARFRAQVAATPQHLAVLPSSGTALTYADLYDAASRLAHHLRVDLGLRPGGVVAVMAARTADTVTALLGTLLAGGVYAPIDPVTPVPRVREIVEATSAAALLLHSAQLDQAAELPNLPACCLDLQVASLPPVAVNGEGADEPCGSDAAAVISTSGSEGRPKAVVLDHAGLVNVSLDHVSELGLGPGDRYLQFMALSFDGSLLDIFMTLLSGATLVLPDQALLGDPDRLQELMAAAGVTVTTMTPSYLRLLDPAPLGALRAVVSAAEVAKVSDATRYARSVDFYNGYGPTEACVNTTLHKVERGRRYATIPLGRPRGNKRVYILDARRRLLPRNAIGEIAIAGRGLARGYHGDPDRTRERFVPNPWPAPAASVDPHGERLYLTGDLGAWDDRGDLIFAGRRDEQVKIRGFRVELGEIESKLLADNRVGDAIALAHPARHDLVAFVRLSLGDGRAGAFPLDADGLVADLLAELGRTLPAYMVPSVIHPVEGFPVNEHGKVDRRRLLALHDLWLAERPVAASESDLEAALAGIWADALGVVRVGTDDDFFRLGGDSIRMIQAVHLAQQSGIGIATSDLVEYRTIRALAAAVTARGGHATPPVPVPLELAAVDDDERADLPDHVEDAYPVSAMQRMMVERYEDSELAGAHTYHCLAGWRVRDEALSVDALRRALASLVTRHRSLRTGIVAAPCSGRLLQLVHDVPAPDVRVVDLRHLDAGGQEDALAEVLAADFADRYEVGRCTHPFSRMWLVHRSPQDADILLSAHHAVIDGWSGVLLQNELFDNYEAFCDGRPVDATAVNVDSYKEFVALEQEAGRDERAMELWAAQFDGARAQRPLWAPRRGPRRFATVHSSVGAADTRRILERCATDGTSPKAVFLSAFAGALCEVTGSRRATVGVITNGRPERLTDPLGTTGMFWNVLPVVCGTGSGGDDDGPPSSPAQLHAVLDRLEPHGRFPLAHLVGDEVIDACFNFIHFHHARPPGGRLVLIEELFAHDRLHHPLVFVVSLESTTPATPATPAGARDLELAVRVEHDTDTVSATLVQGLLAAWHEAVRRLATTPDGRDATSG